MSKMSDRPHGDNPDEAVCVVCFKEARLWSVGVCDHAVCSECSTRMRVLCKQNECPICRREMPKVVFTKRIEPFSVLFPKFERSNLQERHYGIFFCTSEIQKSYYTLLEHRCPVCQETELNWRFKSFNQLKDHMRREHELFFCEICSENLKIFSSERKFYTRQELALHRRKGDPDNTSHRGHPLCEFCDTRFMDTDELFRHLRRNHLFCHLCDADGKHQYYNSIEDLRRHFREEHYLCEEGDCKAMPLTAVYRTDIDLKAHIAQEHMRHLNKSANKQARTLELEFTLAPRPRNENLRNKRYNDRREDEIPLGHNIEPGGTGEPPEGPSRLFINSLTSQDFPALGGTPATSNITVTSRNFSKLTHAPFRGDDFPSLGGSSGGRGSAPAVTITTSSASRSSKAPEVTITRTREDFPSLNTKRGGSTVSVSVNSQESNNPKVSIQVNHSPKLNITTHIGGPPRSSEAFPALGATGPVSQAQWVQPRKKNDNNKSEKAAACPKLPPSDLSSFPSLSQTKSEKPKKTSSVTMPVTQSWAENNKSPSCDSSQQKKSDELSKKLDGLKLVDSKMKLKDISAPDEPAKNKKKKKPKGNDVKTETQNGMVKKRSELKIGTLKNANEPGGSTETTKTTHKSSKNKKNLDPPPGFAQPTGWTTVKPPPGFNVADFPTLGAPNDLTFTNSTGQSYSILPGAVKGYRQPDNFNARNQNLIRNFQALLNDNDAIKDFKNKSDLFRKGSLPAESYIEHCKGVLGATFDDIFPELLVLLPDIQKQQELYGKIPQNAKLKKNLLVCEHCRQIVFRKELSFHYNQHALDNHFPNLDQVPGGNAWGK